MIEAPKRPSAAQVAEYLREGWWGTRTFADILKRRATEHPDRIVFVDAHKQITYGELWSQVNRFAEFLRRQGVEHGDVVTLQMPNRIEFAVVFFSLELIGAIANKISSDLRAVELDYILRFSQSKAYVCAREFKGFNYVDLIQTVRKNVAGLKVVVCVDETTVDGITSFAAAVESSPTLREADRFNMDPDEIMRMCFTSGTTGNPKGVLHSFNTTLCAAEFLSEDMRVTQDDVFLIYLPVGLNWGYLTLLQVVMAGAKGVLIERFSARTALELIEREHVTYIPTAPASIVAILNSEDLKGSDLSSLRVVLTGGASASIEAIKAFQEAVPLAKLVELYGMLETGFHAYTRLDDDPLRVNGTIGRCIRQLELEILDDSGRPVPYGQSGELAAKGPSVHLGYLGNPTANQESFTEDGWFRTGDLGEFVDEAGNVRISGRKKEIINRAGKKYFPREIEEILYENPAFLHLAVVGLPDQRLGERNCLCAVLKHGASVTLDDVLALLKGRVADYKLPEQLELLADLPMTPTGKVRRAELVKQLMQR